MSNFEKRFSGRKAIVTGAASGLGKSVAARIVAEGGSAIIWDIDAKLLSDAKNDVGAIDAIAVDVTSYETVEEAVATSTRALGGVDILVAAAGITGATVPVQSFPLDSWRRVIDVNLNGVFYVCRAVVPKMIEAGYGRIVNVASVAGKEGNPNASAYSASKAGVIGFTKSLGKELATKGVIANCIAPTTFESPILQQLPQSQIDYMRSKIPMNRLGNMSEIVSMVCFMASEECSFTTASTFDISGGRTTY